MTYNCSNCGSEHVILTGQATKVDAYPLEDKTRVEVRCHECGTRAWTIHPEIVARFLKRNAETRVIDRMVYPPLAFDPARYNKDKTVTTLRTGLPDATWRTIYDGVGTRAMSPLIDALNESNESFKDLPFKEKTNVYHLLPVELTLEQTRALKKIVPHTFQEYNELLEARGMMKAAQARLERAQAAWDALGRKPKAAVKK